MITSERAIEFIECLPLSGDYANKKFILREWQKDILRKLFDTRLKDGRRQYREAGIWIPRKNAKTELAAAIAACFLFLDDQQGEIYSAAAEREQAGIIFKKLQHMIESSDLLRDRVKIIPTQKRIIHKKTGTVFASLSSDHASKHGYNPSVVIGDEIHCWHRRELWTALTSGSATRGEPLFLTITTAGNRDDEALEWELYEYACKVRDGSVDDPTFLPVIYEIKKGEDWLDEEVWKRVNPALGDFNSLEAMQQAAAKAQVNTRLENDFRRLHLNEHTQQTTRWLSLDKWNACRDDRPIEKGDQVCGGLDLASTTDIAAWCLAAPRDKGYAVKWKFFIPQDRMTEIEKNDRVPYTQWVREGHVIATPGGAIDYQVIIDEILKDFEDYVLDFCGYDSWNATNTAQKLEAEGLQMVKVTQSLAQLSEPTKDFERAVLEGQLQHGGNPVATWMAGNCECYTDASGNIRPIKPKHGQSAKKIDGLVAAIMAIKLCAQLKDDFINIGALWDD